MKKTRGYNMTARAEATAETGRRILDAGTELFLSLDYEDVTLQAIAERASVTLQTVIRRYGSKESLLSAIAESFTPGLRRSRQVDTPGDIAQAVGRLVASYEELGPANWRMLRQEHRIPVLHDVLVGARAQHQAWIEESFAPLLPQDAGERALRVLQIFAATDLYVWKLLRVDLGRSREDVERLMVGSVGALTGNAQVA